MNKNLNTYLDSYISFMQSKVTYFRSKKKEKTKQKSLKPSSFSEPLTCPGHEAASRAGSTVSRNA